MRQSEGRLRRGMVSTTFVAVIAGVAFGLILVLGSLLLAWRSKARRLTGVIALLVALSIVGVVGNDLRNAWLRVSSGELLLSEIPVGTQRTHLEEYLKENMTRLHIREWKKPSAEDWQDGRNPMPTYFVLFDVGFSYWATFVENKGSICIMMDKQSQVVSGIGWVL